MELFGCKRWPVWSKHRIFKRYRVYRWFSSTQATYGHILLTGSHRRGQVTSQLHPRGLWLMALTFHESTDPSCQWAPYAYPFLAWRYCCHLSQQMKRMMRQTNWSESEHWYYYRRMSGCRDILIQAGAAEEFLLESRVDMTHNICARTPACWSPWGTRRTWTDSSMIFWTRSQEYAAVSEIGIRPDLEDEERVTCRWPQVVKEKWEEEVAVVEFVWFELDMLDWWDSGRHLSSLVHRKASEMRTESDSCQLLYFVGPRKENRTVVSSRTEPAFW